MSFLELKIKQEYRSFRDDVVRDFYIPILKEAVLYKRAVGFFSSAALIEIAKGISGLIKNGGKIQLIVSPVLNADDVEAIKKGYAARNIIESAIMREFKEPNCSADEERLNWLATLISINCLEIKVAFTEAEGAGLYHEKMGILYDKNFNKIAFSGSMNETLNAFRNNYESIDTYLSWSDDSFRVKAKEQTFDCLWNNYEPKIKVIDFPSIALDKLKSYKKDNIEYLLDEEFSQNQRLDFFSPKIPNGVSLHEYQIEAIEKWKEQNHIGIFDMATGTGKTYTGLAAAVELYKNKKKMALIIVCPFQHLVEQWVEDLLKFGFKPIVGYSASSQKKWRERLADDVIDFTIGITSLMCFITTNATYRSDFVSQQLSKLGKNTLLIVDEAHNFGAIQLRRFLLPNIEYRLALSATLERHGDDEGTKTLYDYFGAKCIEYGINRAIKEGKLTHYAYYPKTVYLTDDELDEYRTLSKKIAQGCSKDKFGKLTLSEYAKKLLLQRARIVAGASNKICRLKDLIAPYKHENSILVYCGTASSFDYSSDSSDEDFEGERQIEAVSKMLGNEMGMTVRHFTSRETTEERERIKVQFANSDPYQALIAIKCLDEGVNIPSIKTAFILASTTNPKEYVQRRGRVLRLYRGKNIATIYDFITLPRPLSEAKKATADELRYDISLVRKEVIRMREFAAAADNESETDKLLKELIDIYGDEILGGDFDEE